MLFVLFSSGGLSLLQFDVLCFYWILLLSLSVGVSSDLVLRLHCRCLSRRLYPDQGKIGYLLMQRGESSLAISWVWITSEQAVSFINSTLLASFHMPFLHISDVILTAQTPGGVLLVEPRFEMPGMGLFATNENSRVWTVRFNVGDLCFCLLASLRVVIVVLKMFMRRDLEGVAVRRGNKISRSRVGDITPFFLRMTRHCTNFSRTSGLRLAWCSNKS